MAELRILTPSEFRGIKNNPEGCLIIQKMKYQGWGTFWLQNGVHVGYVAVEGAVKRVYDEYARNCVYPTISCPKASFKIGNIYMFGHDEAGLFFRWIAFSEKILGLCEICAGKSETYFSEPVNKWDKTTCSDSGCAVSRMIDRITKHFTPEEIDAVKDDDLFTKKLVPWDGVLVVLPDISTIPEMRYSHDWSLKALKIFPRSKENPLKIADKAFSTSALCSIEGLEYCNYIGHEAFAYCHNGLGEVRFGKVTYIGEFAFHNSSIRKIFFTDTVGKIDFGAFFHNRIKDIVLDNKVNFWVIETSAFKENCILKEVADAVLEKVLIGHAVNAFSDQETEEKVTTLTF